MKRQKPAVYSAPESEGLSLDDVTVFGNAREAANFLKKTFETWIVIGKAVVRAREIANRRGGKKTFRKLLEQQGLGPVLGKANASHLERIMAKLPEVVRWHEDLPEANQIAWAAPSTIIQKCPDVKKRPKKDDEEKDKPRRKVKLDDALECVRDYLDNEPDDDMKRSVIESLVGPVPEDGDRFKPTDTAEDIATVLVGMFSPRKARDIAERMLRLLSERGRKKQSDFQPEARS